MRFSGRRDEESWLVQVYRQRESESETAKKKRKEKDRLHPWAVALQKLFFEGF